MTYLEYILQRIDQLRQNNIIRFPIEERINDREMRILPGDKGKKNKVQSLHNRRKG